MRILFADDAKIHQDHFLNSIKATAANMGKSLEVVKVVTDGAQLYDAYVEATKTQPIDIVFSDIRMPVEDGLSALVRIIGKRPSQKVVMVSSESAAKMTLAIHQHGTTANKDLELNKKFELIKKVAERIRAGSIEEGKINHILEACEKLALDPILAAKELGACGYVQKPYDDAKLKRLLEHLQTQQSFAIME